ncbi:MAG: DHA2 family efflux MFS transporter permease subunit, partial [Candidatus Limnocylindria bacterium]
APTPSRRYRRLAQQGASEMWRTTVNGLGSARAVAPLTVREPTRHGRGSVGAERPAATLVVVCASLMVITIDVTIVNVALPSLAGALRVDNSGLQWVVAGYELVFAGLLLSAGALGDRFGRRRCLAIGLVIFGAASAASAMADASGQLLASRAVMGVGGALIMPATLSIITNVFTEPTERAKAIAVWAGVAALGLGLGPLVGGWLLQHFYWGSIFLVNVPVVVATLIAVRLLVPESRDTSASRLDPVGAALSIAGLGTVLYAIIEGPHEGWWSATIVTSFAVGAVAMAAFIAWELHVREPMLDMALFRNPRFSASCVAIMSMFFALFSLMFILTQLLQSVLGYSPLEAGIRVVPLPAMLVVFAQVSVRVATRVGTKTVVTFGLLTVAIGLGIGATFNDHSGYGLLLVTITLTGIGMGCTMAPATEAIMGSVPARKAGVGSAVNDTTRLSAGALGIAVVGAVLSSTYDAGLASGLQSSSLPARTRDAAGSSIGSAVEIAHGLGGAQGDDLLAVARHAFIAGADQGLMIAAAVAALGAIIAWRFLPAQADPS